MRNININVTSVQLKDCFNRLKTWAYNCILMVFGGSSADGHIDLSVLSSRIFIYIQKHVSNVSHNS